MLLSCLIKNFSSETIKFLLYKADNTKQCNVREFEPKITPSENV